MPAQQDIDLDAVPLDFQAVLANVKVEAGRAHSESMVSLSIARAEGEALREAANAARAARNEAQQEVEQLRRDIGERDSLIGRLQESNAALLARVRTAEPVVVEGTSEPAGEPIHVTMTDGSVSADEAG